MPAEARQPHARIGGERLVDDEPALVLADGLVGVEERRDRIRLSRVGLPLRVGEAERILRMRLVLRAADHGDAGGLAGVEGELGIRDLAHRRRMVAIAVRVEIAVGADVADAVLDAGRFDPDVDRVVAARARRKS